MNHAHRIVTGGAHSHRVTDHEVTSAALARHDLVWLDPAAATAITVGRAEDRRLTIDWLENGRPFVVRRDEEWHRHGKRDQIALGLPLPTSLGRRRIGLRAPRAMMTRVESMPILADAIVVAFPEWQEPLRVLADRASQCRAVVRAYGSLGWQYLVGDNYLHSASDVDLLIEPRPGFDVSRLLSILSESDATDCPRLDGEIRLAPDRTVAWRELLKTTNDVLVRGLDGVFMIPRSAALALLMPSATR